MPFADVDDAGQKLPGLAVQGVHWAVVPEPLVEYDPAGQGKQDAMLVAPASEYVPAAQFWHEPEATAANVPAGHCWHVAAGGPEVERENCPLVHGVGTAMPGEGQMLPAGQGVQEGLMPVLTDE